MIIHRRRNSIHRFVRQTFYKLYNRLKKLYWRLFKPDAEGVKMMVFNSQGEILLVQIGYMHKLWVIPGGTLDKGETKEHAAKRELYEEIRVTVDACELAFTLKHQAQYKKDTVHYLIANSEVTDFIIDDEEIIDVRWFAQNSLPENRTQRVDMALTRYNEVK